MDQTVKQVPEPSRPQADPSQPPTASAELFFELSPDLFAIADPEGFFLRTNDAWMAVLGYSSDELQGMTILDLVHPDDQAATQQVRAEITQGKTVEQFVNRYRHKDGSWRFLSWRSRPADGLIHGVAHDVTAEVTAEMEMTKLLQATDATHRNLFAAMHQGVIYQSPDGRIQEANLAAQRILGLNLEQLQGKSLVNLDWRSVHWDLTDFPLSAHPATQVLRTGVTVNDVEMGVFNPVAQCYRWIRVDSQPVERDGQRWALTIFTDVTDLREAINEAGGLRAAIDQHDILSITDRRGVILDVNAKFCETSGYRADELIGRTHNIIASGIHDAEFFGNLWATIAGGGVWNGEICNRRKDGSHYWVLSTIMPMTRSETGVDRYISIRTDITEQKVAEEVAAHAALSDELTGLANRRRFDSELSHRWRMAIATEQPLALVMLDIDDFKRYNDALGHQSGDDALRKVAAALTSSARRGSDLIARWGGEEFAVLATDTDLAGALVLATKLVAAVQGLDLAHPDSRSGEKLTVSAGVAATTSSSIVVPSDLIREADDQLYRAKAAGRNQVACGSD